MNGRKYVGIPLVILGSILALSDAASGCGASGGSSGDSAPGGKGKYECVGEELGPKVSSDGRTITGAVRVVCMVPPKSHHATLYLEYHSTGTKYVLESHDRSDDMPPLALQVISKCRVGTWRLRYVATGVDASGLPYNVEQINKEVFVHTCP